MIHLLLATTIFAIGPAMRTCHQTCAELLNHDARCEQACAAKDKQPTFATFCPEYEGCLRSCDARGSRSSAAWGDCRDVCTAISVRVDCGNGEAPPGGAGGMMDGSPQSSSGSIAMNPSSVREEARAVPAPAPVPTPASGETALLKPFDAKGQMPNVKIKGTLQPSSGLEGIVESAIKSGRDGGAELTLFERVHRKYQEARFTAPAGST